MSLHSCRLRRRSWWSCVPTTPRCGWRSKRWWLGSTMSRCDFELGERRIPHSRSSSKIPIYQVAIYNQQLTPEMRRITDKARGRWGKINLIWTWTIWKIYIGRGIMNTVRYLNIYTGWLFNRPSPCTLVKWKKFQWAKGGYLADFFR